MSREEGSPLQTQLLVRGLFDDRRTGSIPLLCPSPQPLVQVRNPLVTAAVHRCLLRKPHTVPCLSVVQAAAPEGPLQELSAAGLSSLEAAVREIVAVLTCKRTTDLLLIYSSPRYPEAEPGCGRAFRLHSSS